MAFVKKTWKDRISDYPNRRVIDDGITSKVVTVSRSEGSVTEEGDAFNASNMNDLEQRIFNATQGGGGGGASALTDLSDVNISDVQDGETLVYDEASEKWVNGQGGGKQTALTQAEYDALVQAGTVDPTMEYFITDGIPESAKHNYSTDEQVVGTWIDGKTLYEKVVSITSDFSASMTVAHGISNLGEVVEFNGILSTSNGYFEPLLDEANGDPRYRTRVGDFNSTDFAITIGASHVSIVSKINVIIRYTKSST